MMASVDAEAEMENLFAGDDLSQEGGVENTQSLTQEEEEQRAAGGANLDVTGAGEVKKRVIRNPQPKLNPERVMGPRGIQTIEDLYSDWEGRGKGKEFDDLDVVMKRLEHWAHRLFPRLPFDNVLDVMANRLGTKKVVQTHVKKIRLGMVTAPVHIGGEEDEEQKDQEEREVERYGEEEQPDVFGELLRRAGGEDVPLPPVQRVGQVGGLTDEQRERIRKNKELAAQKKREKQEREQREAEEELKTQQMGADFDDEDEIEREMMSAPAATEWSQKSPEKDKKDATKDGASITMEDVDHVVAIKESSREATAVEETDNGESEELALNSGESMKESSRSTEEIERPSKSVDEDGSDDVIGLDEMLEQMDED